MHPLTLHVVRHQNFVVYEIHSSDGHDTIAKLHGSTNPMLDGMNGARPAYDAARLFISAHEMLNFICDVADGLPAPRRAAAYDLIAKATTGTIPVSGETRK